jgi:hypothetical protein
VIIYEKNIRGPPAAGRTVNIISNSENPSKCLAMSMILTLFYFELEPGVTTFQPFRKLPAVFLQGSDGFCQLLCWNKDVISVPVGATSSEQPFNKERNAA